MDLITTHVNTDLDGLAAMVAAQKIYPGAQMVFPGKISRAVAEFMALYKDTFRVKKAKEVDLANVKRLILVDFKNPGRNANMRTILKNPGVEIHIYDHHPWADGDVHGEYEMVEPVGAATTLLVEEIKRREIGLNQLEATLMLMGIYEDTGCLLFTSTTPRDILASAFLLQQGANLAVAGSFLVRPMKSDQRSLLGKLAASTERLSINGVQVLLASSGSDEYVDGLATLTHKLAENTNCDAVFVLVEMDGRVQVVGRSASQEVNAKEILQEMGGGGHPAAASASLKGESLENALDRIRKIIHDKVKPLLVIGDIMSSPVKTVTPDTSIDAAKGIMLRYGHSGLPVVSGREVVGVISRRDVEKAVHHGLGHAPVKGYMARNVTLVEPDNTVTLARKLMIDEDIGRLPVVENGALVGILSRSDVLRTLHGEYGYQNVTEVYSQSCHVCGVTKNFNELIRETLPGILRKILYRASELSSETGCNVYAVGGFVRDLLLGEECFDLDIVVEGDSIRLANLLAKEFGGKITTHEEFKTSSIVFSDKYHVDVAEARVEYYEYPAALPKVETSTLRHDLYRRDFTINSMAIALNYENFGLLIDYYCGHDDLRQGLIRVLHNLSFVEDPTRILRAFRFEQRYSLKFEERTGELLEQAVRDGMLSRVSKGRLCEEIKLYFDEKEPGKLLRRLGDSGTWSFLFPGIDYNDIRGIIEVLAENVELVAGWLPTGPARLTPSSTQPTGSMRPCVVYFGAILHKADLDTVENICKRYNFSKREIEDIKAINRKWAETVNCLRRPGKKPVSEVAVKILTLPVEAYPLLLAYLEAGKQRRWLHQVMDAVYYNRPYIGGNDIIGLGVPPGPVYREILNEVWRAKLDGLVATREEELDLAHKFLESKKGV